MSLEGAANSVTDDYLISMLREKPKHVKVLQTRHAFRKFFSGISKERMELLLREAYVDQPAPDMEKRVIRRLTLMEGHMEG